jgi:hypothetical protein
VRSCEAAEAVRGAVAVDVPARPPRHELRRGRPGGFARVVGATLMAELSYGGVRTREEELQVPSAYG